MKTIFITSLALLAVVATAMPTSAPIDTDAAIALRDLEARAATCSNGSVDRLAFQVSMKTFQKARKAKDPSQCIWKSDGCSKSPDRPAKFNFKPSCERHDFGYRNTKKQKRFTKAMKKRIDAQFLKDLKKYCAGFSGFKAPLGVVCRRYADIYFTAVSKLGRRDLDDISIEAIARRGEVLEDFVGDQLDPDIKGQQIPELTDDYEDDDEGSQDVEDDEE